MCGAGVSLGLARGWRAQSSIYSSEPHRFGAVWHRLKSRSQSRVPRVCGYFSSSALRAVPFDRPPPMPPAVRLYALRGGYVR